MYAFLNERSLEQHADWIHNLTAFLQAAQELLSTDAVLYRDSEFFARGAFKAKFNTLSVPKDVRSLIREVVFGMRYYKCWRPERQSDSQDTYVCENPTAELRDESLAEAAERLLRADDVSVAVLSAPQTAFAKRGILSITKLTSGKTVHLPNIAVPDVLGWIASQRGYYDRDAHSAPKDFQTVLATAPERFRYSGKIERGFGRRVFEEIETGYQYYVDDGHHGHSAHLEVFSRRGEHLGTADIDSGILDEATRVNGRRLRL